MFNGLEGIVRLRVNSRNDELKIKVRPNVPKEFLNSFS